MTYRVAITSQKGGVGKTTVALNLAVAFAERGQRTLLVDTDPQGGIGHSLARGETALLGLCDLVMGAVPPEQAVLQTKLPGLSLLPRGLLDPIDARELERALGEPETLHAVLDATESGFDVVLIDTPAGLGAVTYAVLSNAHGALVPFQAEPLALRTISQILGVVHHLRATDNPELALLGLLMTMVDRESEPALTVLGEAWSGFAGVLDTMVPRAPAFSAASLEGLPLAFVGGRASPEARRFDLLANELEGLMHGGGERERERRELL